MIKRTERGWAGHFIGGSRCAYHRNTLLEKDEVRMIVSTVGGYQSKDEIIPIGSGGRYYETMAFMAKLDGPYWDIAVEQQLDFRSDWAICAESVDDLPDDVDNQADAMHETVVAEFIQRLEQDQVK